MQYEHVPGLRSPPTAREPPSQIYLRRIRVRLWPLADLPALRTPCPLLEVNRTWVGSSAISASDPVWTGRALQAEYEEVEGVGLAHLYPALA
jgi:hypothetical protein